MAVVKGTVRQFNQNVFPQAQAFELVFTPSGPGVTGTTSYWGAPVAVQPETDGSFTINLVATVGLVPDVWFEVSPIFIPLTIRQGYRLSTQVNSVDQL